jgi:hypothetical protein
MNADNLWLHLVAGFEDGQERVDGFLYFLRDSLYTVLAECWFDSPQASLCLPDGIRQFQALCGGSRTVAGFIDVGRNRWVNTLLAHGARYVKMAINVEWEV